MTDEGAKVKTKIVKKKNIPVNSRVTIANKPELGPGTVRFVGPTKFGQSATARWVGIQMDSAAEEGRNNGTVLGVSYFDCPPNKGLFVKPSQVIVQQSTSGSRPTSPRPSTPSQPVSSTLTSSRPKSPRPNIPSQSASGTSAGRPASPHPKATTAQPKLTESTITSKAKKVESATPVKPSSIEEEPTPIQASVSSSLTTLSEPKKISKIPTISTSLSSLKQSPKKADMTLAETSIKKPTPEPQQVSKSPHDESLTKKIPTTSPLTQESHRGIPTSIQKPTTRELGGTESQKQARSTVTKENFASEKELSTNLTIKSEPPCTLVSESTFSEDSRTAEIEEQLALVEEQLELVTVEKELAEERAEELQRQLEESKQQLSELQERLEQPLPGAESGETLASFGALEAQNQTLRETLVKLRDLSVQEKEKNIQRIAILEEEVSLIPQIEEEFRCCKRELSQRTIEVEELQEAVDEASEHSEMIEKLTESNLSLGEQVAALKQRIKDQEQSQLLSEELEAEYVAVEKQLRHTLQDQEVTNLNLADKVESLTAKHKEYEKAILMFRDVIKELKEKVAFYESKTENEAIHSSELVQREHVLMGTITSLQARSRKARVMEIEAALEQHKATQAYGRLSFLQNFFSENVIQFDNDAFSFYQLIDRISFKSSLARTYLRGEIYPDDDETTSTLLEEEIFSLEVEHLLSSFEFVSKDFSILLMDSNCQEDLYKELGKLYYELSLHEQVFDSLLALIKQDSFTFLYPLSNLKEPFQHFVRSRDAAVPSCDEYRPVWRTMYHYLENVRFSLSILILLNTKLQYLFDNNEIPLQQFKKVVTFPTKKIRAAQERIRQILSNITDKNLKRSSSKITALIDCQTAVSKTVSKYQEIINSVESFVKGDENLSLESFKSMFAKAIGFDTVKEDQEPCWSIIEESFDLLSDVVSCIISGELDLPFTGDDLVIPLWQQHAQTMRASTSKSTLGDQFHEDKADSEEIETIKIALAQAQSLYIEEQRKQDALLSRIKILQKNEDEMYVALNTQKEAAQQQEETLSSSIEQLSTEKEKLIRQCRVLKKKLEDTSGTRSISSKMLVSRPREGSINFTDSHRRVANAEISALKGALHQSIEENKRLRSEYARHRLSISLPPLRKSSEISPELVACSTEINKLLQKICLQQATSSVVSLGTKSLHQIQMEREEIFRIAKTSDDLKIRLSDIIESYVTSIHSTSITQWPNPALGKILSSNTPHIIGKVSIPTCRKSERSSLTINRPQFLALHKCFAT